MYICQAVEYKNVKMSFCYSAGMLDLTISSVSMRSIALHWKLNNCDLINTSNPCCLKLLEHQIVNIHFDKVIKNIP